MELDARVWVSAWCVFMATALLIQDGAEAQAAASNCSKARTCSECWDIASECRWCSDESEVWRVRNRCQASGQFPVACVSTVTASSSYRVTENNAFEDDVQVRPQRISARLRSQEKITFTVAVQPARNYPLDVYYLMDHSFSMRDDLANMKAFGTDIASSVKNLTSGYRLGYGTFVDKPLMPFVLTGQNKVLSPCKNCKLPYAFYNALSLTNDAGRFAGTLNNDTISGNWDTPEGAFDAMIQVAVCTQEIGWRANSRRVLLTATDAKSHIGGEGAYVGATRANDGKCHVDPSTHYYVDNDVYDFPSLSFTSHIMQRERILPVFMAVSTVVPWYRSAVQIMASTGARVVQLSRTSDNVVQLLRDELSRLVRVARVLALPQSGAKITVVASCPDSGTPSLDTETGFQQCTNLDFDKEARFNITLEGLRCNTLRDTKQITLRFFGFGDVVVDLEPLCQCPCEATGVNNSAFCSGQGSSQCGICSCNQGFTDKVSNISRCDCNTVNISPCIEQGDSAVCNGRGDCVCQECQCGKPPAATVSNAAFSGKYCECDNFNCPATDTGAICGGSSQGSCVCGACQCLSGYEGPNCGCPLSSDTCKVSSSDATVCSGVGTCTCGQCQCESGYAGDFCEMCSTLLTDCERAALCFNCSQGTGPNRESNGFDGRCTPDCPGLNSTVSKENNPTVRGESALQCIAPLNLGMGCTSRTFYARTDKSKGGSCNQPFYQFVIKECPPEKQVDYVPFTVGPVIAIIAIAAAIILLAKLYCIYRDRMEYRVFQKEAEISLAAGKGVNPLFKKPTTIYKNPEYQGNDGNGRTPEYE